MATTNSINANASHPLAAINGGTGVSSPTAHGIMVAEGSSAVSSKVLTNGQLLIGSTGADPSATTLTAGSGVTITNAAGSITIAASGGGGGTNPTVYFVDYNNGSDSNSGAISSPWLTLQHAYTTLHASATTANPMTIVLSSSLTGTNPDSGTITGYANINLTSLNGLGYVFQDINIGGTSTTQDQINISNIFINNNFTWSISNANITTLNLDNVTIEATLTYTNAGTGGAPYLNCNNSAFVGITLLAFQSIFTSCQFPGAPSAMTLDDGVHIGGSSSYLLGGVTTTLDINATGENSIYLAGMIGGVGVTGTTAGPNTPLLFTDDSSTTTSSYSGVTVTLDSQANLVASNYTPVHYTAVSSDVTGNLQGIDNALGSASGFTWSVHTSSTALVANDGFFANSASLLTFTLPTTAAVGATFAASEMSTGTFKIAQNASQQITFGASKSTAGTGGSLTSTALGDTVTLVCTVANTDFQVISSIGSLTLV